MSKTTSTLSLPNGKDDASTFAESTKFEIQRLYLKKQFAEVPYAPGVFQQEPDVKPETTVEMKIEHQIIKENLVEVTLGFHIQMKLKEQTALRMEIQQSGLFQMTGYTSEQQGFLINAFCANLLHPYARKVVADLSYGAGFLPITLPPINFDQAYQERQKTAQSSSSEPTTVIEFPSESADMRAT